MFETKTWEMIQDLVFPLLKTFTGFDAVEFAGEKSVLFTEVGEGLDELSKLFLLAGTALEDGKLTAEEIEAIVAQALTLPDALDAISSVFADDDEVIE